MLNHIKEKIKISMKERKMCLDMIEQKNKLYQTKLTVILFLLTEETSDIKGGVLL